MITKKKEILQRVDEKEVNEKIQETVLSPQYIHIKLHKEDGLFTNILSYAFPFYR